MAAGRVLVALVALATAGTVAGCRETANLSQQEVVVVFKPNATAADHARVWSECPAMPQVSPEPLITTSKYPSVLLSNVRYRVDHASNYDLQQLYNCLRKDSSVAGYTTTGDEEQ